MDNGSPNEYLSTQERRQLKKQREQKECEKEQRKRMAKKLVNIALVVLIIGSAVFALGWYVTSRPSLPPITMEGHIEQSPPSHIIDKPIPENIQKHMFEHADGRGKPGVIIQYNCNNYSCESDLVEKLTTLVKEYPENVYLAPNNYNGKIILTKLGKREILESFDEQAIRYFIE